MFMWLSKLCDHKGKLEYRVAFQIEKRYQEYSQKKNIKFDF